MSSQNQEKEAAVIQVTQGQVLTAGEYRDGVWHYEEEFLPGGGSPKPPSPGSLEQGEGAASSGGFVALNLSSGRQDSKEWVMVERPSGSPGGKATRSPSEEDDEPEVLQPEEQSPGREKGSPSPGSGKAKQESSSSSNRKMDKLELSVGPVGALPPITPTSPAEALAEGVLTQVGRSHRMPPLLHGKHDTDRSRHFTQLKSCTVRVLDLERHCFGHTAVRNSPAASCCSFQVTVSALCLLAPSSC